MQNREREPGVIKALILSGGLLVLLSGIVALLGFPIGFTFAYGHLMLLVLHNVSALHGIIETISGIVLLLVSLFMDVGKEGSLQDLSIIAMVFSIASLIGGGGFLAGFVLTFIGSVFGISYAYVAPSRGRYRARLGATVKRAVPVKEKKVLLNQEERRLYDIIQRAEGAIFQAELVEKSGFTKVKVTRILDRLEGRGLVERRRRGMTNVVILKAT